MKLWRWVLLLLLVAAIAAFGWHWVAEDPGYVLIRLRGWRVQSSLVVAIIALLLFWAVLSFAWRAIRWPWGAWRERRRRVGRQRLAQGLVALYEGRHGEAERALGRAAKQAPLRAPALLAAADAARRRGATDRALEMLDDASQEAPQAARVLRARTLRDAGRAEQALHLLGPEADNGKLTPAGWREWVSAALDAGEPQRARSALEPLRKSGALGATAYTALETQVLRATIAQAPSADALKDLWRALSRNQRTQTALIASYAQRAEHFGAGLAAMDEVESALKRDWNDALLRVYGDLDGDHGEARIHRAEKWLDTHTDDAVLLATLGRMCARQGLWGKAHDYLHHALALQPSAQAWEALGDVASGQADQAAAANCYQNALKLQRGESTTTLPAIAQNDGDPEPEERGEHGLPRLPAG